MIQWNADNTVTNGPKKIRRYQRGGPFNEGFFLQGNVGSFNREAKKSGRNRRELFNTLKKEANLILDSMTPSSAFATLVNMKQGEKTQKIVAKYIYDRFRERDRRVKYNLV